MTEPRSTPSQEPGHRYTPRQAVPRLLSDVHRPVQAAPRALADAHHAQAGRSVAREHPDQLSVAQRPAAVPLTQAEPTGAPMQVMAPNIAARYQKTVSPPTVPRAPSARQRITTTTKPAAPRLHRSLVLHRRIVDKAASHKKQAKQQRIKTVYAFGLGGLAALVFMSGVLVLTGRFTNHQSGVTAAASQSADAARTLGVHTDQASTSVTEDEVAAEAVDNYDVPAQQPRVVIIPRLHVQSRIMQVRQGYNGEPLQTENLFDFGWMADSELPGSNGVTVLSGYTAGPTKLGPLATIAELKVGDDITIERGDGKSYVYKVIRSQMYDANKVDMAAVRSPAIAGKAGLNLLTYTGRFNVRTNQYEKRTVIFAAMQ